MITAGVGDSQWPATVHIDTVAGNKFNKINIRIITAVSRRCYY